MRTPTGLFLLVTAALCSGQSRAPASATAEPTTTYHSEAMGFDFVYPSGFVNKGPADSASAKGQGAPGDKKATDSCVTYPIGAMDMRNAFNMIFLKRFDTACLGTETTATNSRVAVVSFLYDWLREFGKPNTSSTTEYDIGGHMAAMVSGSVKVQGDAAGTVIYGTASCLVAGRNLACFAFLSSDCQSLAVLSASRIKFTGAAATPLIPARLVPACKPSS